ncbi:MAG: choice-of-anchor Q domain-containing protein, partial [Armatimonadota bacterium]
PDKTTGVTKITVGFSKASPDWDSSYKGEIGLGSEWLRCDIPLTCKSDFAPKEARLVVTFGYPAQQAEIADVQVLNFGPGVPLASLPKTRRFADKYSPEILKREMTRIAALRRELDAVRNPSPAKGKTLLVATNGSATGDGTKAKPFATIPQALAAVQPGDTILVGAGEYREPKGISVRTSGRPDAWIKIKAAPGTRPKIVTSSWSGFELRGGIHHIEVEGFELEWVKDPSIVGDGGITVHGVGLAPMYASHHLRFLNNVIHGYGTGGICSLDCDYLYLEGNVIYDTAKTSPYGGSAISLCRSFNSDDAPGYHNVLRRNICYDNELKVSVLETSGGNGKALTDGNGIIIDVFKRSRANPLKPHGEDRNGPLLPYRGRTLVENNLVYNNGGRGVHVFRSDKVDVVNNTCYMNQKSADINAGELTAIESDQVVIANNIAYARLGKRGNTQDGSARVIWADNLFFNADDILIHDGLVQSDPLFVAAALNAKPKGFRLRPGSPALGKGMTLITPANDLDGKPRPKTGPVDLGAYQVSRGK